MLQQHNVLSLPSLGAKNSQQDSNSDKYRPKRMLRITDVKERTGLSRSTIYSKLDPKSHAYDPTFPIQVKLGARAVAWLEDEIDTWLQKQLIRRSVKIAFG